MSMTTSMSSGQCQQMPAEQERKLIIMHVSAFATGAGGGGGWGSLQNLTELKGRRGRCNEDSRVEAGEIQPGFNFVRPLCMYRSLVCLVVRKNTFCLNQSEFQI